MMPRLLVGAVGLAMLATACGDAADVGSRDSELTIVASTTILGDVVSQIVGDDATVEVLLPVGADPHDYRPSSQQVASLTSADLVVVNGLGLEEGLEDVIETAEADGANILAVAAELSPIALTDEDGHHDEDADHEEDADHDDDADHEHGAFDPHVWLDPIRMATAATLIGDRLAAVDASVDWGARSEAYAAELRDLSDDIAEALGQVEARVIITNHDSLAYFAESFGFEVVGTIVPAVTTQAEPSSADLADLVEIIEETGVPAIFAETTSPSSLAEAVAAEVGFEVRVVELYTGSVGEAGSGADTYVGMMRINAERIAEALS